MHSLESFVEKLMERAEERKDKLESVLPNFEAALQLLSNEKDVFAPVFKLGQIVNYPHPLGLYRRAGGRIIGIIIKNIGTFYNVEFGKGVDTVVEEKELLKLNT
jgi:hypothetical protein